MDKETTTLVKDYLESTNKTTNMSIRNFLVCYYTSQKDYDNRETVLPKKAAVSSDNQGRINEEWMLKGQIKLQEGETFILWHIQQIA